MRRFYFAFAALAAVLLSSCSSKQIALRENWIDERDLMSLQGAPVSEWVAKVGRPTLVEISGDTGIYYYNYRPTMYAVGIYNGEIKEAEVKPDASSATEVWGSRKNVMQIKVLNDRVISASVTSGPDKKVFVRDLNGEIILDPTSGYTTDFSEEQKMGQESKEYGNAYSNINTIMSKYTWPKPVVSEVPVQAQPVVPSAPIATPVTLPAAAPASLVADSAHQATPAVVPAAHADTTHNATPAAPADSAHKAIPAATPAAHADTTHHTAVPAATPASPATVPAANPFAPATVPAATPAAAPATPATAPAKPATPAR